MVCYVMSNGKEKDLKSFSKPLVDRCGHTFPKHTQNTPQRRFREKLQTLGTRQEERDFILKSSWLISMKRFVGACCRDLLPCKKKKRTSKKMAGNLEISSKKEALPTCPIHSSSEKHACGLALCLSWLESNRLRYIYWKRTQLDLVSICWSKHDSRIIPLK